MQPWPPVIVSIVSGVRAITLGCHHRVHANRRESEAGSAQQLPPAHFRVLAGTSQWTKTE